MLIYFCDEFMQKNKVIKGLLIYSPIIFCTILIGISLYFGVSIVDENVSYTISKNIGYNTLELMKVITTSCSAIAIMLVVLLVILTAKDKNIGIIFAINIVLCYVLNFIIKFVVKRERPLEYMLIPENGYSFPSAHSMISVTFYGFLAYMAIRFVKNKYLKVSFLVLSILGTLLVGFSRICLGVHYFSDVVCGFLFGYIYLLLFLKVTGKYILK
ncbi:pAP2 family protein [Clostridium sp. CAG:1219]|nr:pAP2 family protein [Clostridium sp. CAG:1219]